MNHHLLAAYAIHQDLIAINQSGVLGVNELDSLDELVAGLDVELFERFAENCAEDGDKLGC
jgi:hypothetical protein